MALSPTLRNWELRFRGMPTEAPKKLLSILQCARSVFFLNQDTTWPLSNGGSAFVVRFRDRHFVLTAKHVLNLRNFRPDQFRVQYHSEAKEFIPIKHLHTLRGPDSCASDQDNDQFDIAIWTLHDDHFNPEKCSDQEPYHLKSVDRLTIFDPRGDYLYRGFPIKQRSYDTEARHMFQVAVSGRARYVERTEYTCLHKIRLVNLADDLKDLDGLSGSPLFQVHNDTGKLSHEALAGMLLRGSRPSEMAYFLEHARIVQILEYVYGRKDDT
jgi:hypothetical protein